VDLALGGQPSILRVLPDGTTVVAQSGESAADQDFKGTVTFLAGSQAKGLAVLPI